MRNLRLFGVSTLIVWLSASTAFSQDHFCACMIGSEPVLRALGLTVFAFTSLTDDPARQRALAAARIAVEKQLADLGFEFRWDFVSSAILMQCRFLQSGGAAALGAADDLSPSVRKGLFQVSLYYGSQPGVSKVFLFLNPHNPEGGRLIRILTEGR